MKRLREEPKKRKRKPRAIKRRRARRRRTGRRKKPKVDDADADILKYISNFSLFGLKVLINF